MIGDRGQPPTARVAVTTRSLWMLRLRAEALRYLVCLAALLGLLASARMLVSPPVAVVRNQAVSQPAETLDRGAEAFATSFVRSYLTWSAEDPSTGERTLARYYGSGFEPDGGLELPASGAQRVQWAEVVQMRPASNGGHVYTVAAQTSTAGVLYLSIGVERASSGTLSLTGYPAFVSVPTYGPASEPVAGHTVADPALLTVVQRALRNYLAGAVADLEADLARDARVSTPATPLSLETMQRPYWTGSGTVLAVVQARDARDVQYTLAYQLGVTRTQDRWEITEVQGT